MFSLLKNRTTNYISVKEVINRLNKSGVNYLILRNYEQLLNDEIYVNGHEDIDILCSYSKDIIKCLKATSNRRFFKDKTHYHIFISGNRVNLDLRYVGDGYYDKKWQEDMLKHKIIYNDFYVMNKEDYFFSLIYHAIFHKKDFVDDYKIRLKEMAISLGFKNDEYNESLFISILEKYMLEKGYYYVYSVDNSIPLNFNKANSKLISHNCYLSTSHKYFNLKEKILSSKKCKLKI